jgi:hypothetical protein
MITSTYLLIPDDEKPRSNSGRTGITPRLLFSPAAARGERRIQDLRFKTKATPMPINHEEIIEDIEGQIRKCGGAWGE